MSTPQQSSTPPSRWIVLAWLVGVWVAGFAALSCLTIIPLIVANVRFSGQMEQTATARAGQSGQGGGQGGEQGGGFGFPGTGQGDVPGNAAGGSAPNVPVANSGDRFNSTEPVTFRIADTMVSFALSVWSEPSTESMRVRDLIPGEVFTCPGTVRGGDVVGTARWAYCPELGGYISFAVIEQVEGGLPPGEAPAGGFVAPELPTAAPLPTLPLPPTPEPLPTATSVPSATPAPSPAPLTSSSEAPGLPGVGPVAYRAEGAAAPPGQDLCRNATSFEATNIADDDPATAWRVLGDGTGASLRLTFPAPVIVAELQVLTGYAKVDPCDNNVDRWPQGYRPSVITVRFSDGSSHPPLELDDVRELQSLPLSQPVTTQWLDIQIDQTRPPLESGAPRPYAAISEIVVIGGQP